jgi:hypothetical protein
MGTALCLLAVFPQGFLSGASAGAVVVAPALGAVLAGEVVPSPDWEVVAAPTVGAVAPA